MHLRQIATCRVTKLKIEPTKMKLTDNEKREILKLIEAEKPLPDKYRFLLFDDKREVELVWNGKTNEVTNIVLPFQVIERRRMSR